MVSISSSVGRAVSRLFSSWGKSRAALPRSARSCSCGFFMLFFKRVRASDFVLHTSPAGTIRLRSSFAWRKKLNLQVSSSAGACSRKQVRNGTDTAFCSSSLVQEFIFLAKAAISSVEASSVGSFEVRDSKNCWGRGVTRGLRPLLGGRIVSCSRLLRTRESAIPSTKLLARSFGEDLSVGNDLRAWQLGGMAFEKRSSRSRSVSSITAFHREYLSLTAGTNCSFATSSRE